MKRRSCFLGQFYGHIDAEGRFGLPSALRPRLTPGMVVTRGLDKCLLLFARQEWQELAQKLSGLPLALPRARSLRRLLFAGALDCVADGDGRITLPEELRAYARIRGDLVLVGLGNHMEIWSPVCWGQVLASLEAEAGSLAEGLVI